MHDTPSTAPATASVRIDAGTKRRLKALAALRGRALSDLADEAITRFLAAEEQRGDHPLHANEASR